MTGFKNRRMTKFPKTRTLRSFREIWKLSVLVAVVSHASFLYSQNQIIEVWNGSQRNEIQVQNLYRNGTVTPNDKARAQQALRDAQTQMQLGNFNRAVQLARFADSFLLSWGPTEISPRQILMQLRAFQKQNSKDRKTRRKVKPFLWDSTNFLPRRGFMTEKRVPTQPVVNSAKADDRFRFENRFPSFPDNHPNRSTANRSSQTLPRSWENTDRISEDPWPHSESAIANPKNRSTDENNSFIIDNKKKTRITSSPLSSQPSVNPQHKPAAIAKQNSEKPVIEHTGRELFTVPQIPQSTQQPQDSTTSKTSPTEKESSTLLLNSTMNLVSTIIGVIAGALGVIFLLKLFGKQLGPLVKVEVIGDGAVLRNTDFTTESGQSLTTERSVEEVQKHFEIPELGSSYAEKRKAEAEKKQQQEQEIFKLILDQNIELRDQLAGLGNHAA